MIAIYAILFFFLAPIFWGIILGILEDTPPEEYVEEVEPLLLTKE